MNQPHPITIVGGGVVGLSIAWELARRGAIVRLLERGRIGRATSRAGAGILPAANFQAATDPLDQLRGLSHRLFPEWCAQLRSLTGIDCGFRRCGGWYLADTRGEQAAMTGMTGYWKEVGIDCEYVPPAFVTEHEPALASWIERSGEASVWWVPGEAQVRPPRLLRALEAACRHSGVELIENAAVSEIHLDDSGRGTIVADRTYASDAIVVCAGSWTGQVARSLQLEVSIVPIRGQMLLLRTEAPLLRSVVNLGHRYIVCRDDGHTLVGSCEEETGFQLGTTPSMLRSLRDFAIHIIPALESATQVDAWSGLRPLTVDGLPMIGRVPGTGNVYVAAGHFRSGVHLSPGTAVVIADLITGRQPPLGLDAFRVGKHQYSSLPVSQHSP
jgi:glycine oxidase